LFFITENAKFKSKRKTPAKLIVYKLI